MYKGSQLDDKIFDSDHIREVLVVIQKTFPKYFASFISENAQMQFAAAIQEFEHEQERYLKYFDEEALEEYEDDPNAFKKHTRNNCPIIHRCLMSNDEIMNDYKSSFNLVSGRELLDTVQGIAKFGKKYNRKFDHASHDKIKGFDELGLDSLAELTCAGVVGYGIQSNFLYMLYPHAFAYRAQDAVWSLFFLSDKQKFDFEEGSEFVIYATEYGTGEQNYLYPPELFGFYMLKIYLMLKEACRAEGIKFKNEYRYIYLDTFARHVANTERNSINFLKKSSDYVETHWH